MSHALVANATDGTVSTFAIDGEQLVRRAVTEVGPGVSTFAVAPELGLVFAGVKGSDGGGPQILTLRFDEPSGKLEEISRRESPVGATYLELTPNRRTLLCASYHDGVGLAWPVDAEGILGEPGGRIEYPNLHCVVAAYDEQAYFVSLGADLIARCDIDADANLAVAATAPAPQGSGPRHLVLDATRTAAYVITEYSGEVLQYSRDHLGQLHEQEKVSIVDPDAGLQHSRLGADPNAEPLIWGADLQLDPQGRAVWASERGASTIATIDFAGDRLGSVVQLQGTEPQPRGFNVSPDGAYVLVTGERSTTVTLYRVGDAGQLEQADRAETGNGANWVRFI
ncbi:lactonase family protein [Parenemella sanctibonifatiensis]|uniref:6-phosphogluconolactonase n=1 Tax=Parenemella sanctibonifatiensis TaxID=2016505 RepID=A0A255E908_9ACTN|nr:beta-propeller fold lactonase family protein [Parenemella sanctibonifatiensis]OYN88054.1 6-phosphogluconolactonase [Parenemella sanctibonifatiensis]